MKKHITPNRDKGNIDTQKIQERYRQRLRLVLIPICHTQGWKGIPTNEDKPEYLNHPIDTLEAIAVMMSIRFRLLPINYVDTLHDIVISDYVSDKILE